MDTPKIASLRTTYRSLMGVGKVVMYASFATPVVLIAAVGLGLMPVTMGADTMVPASAAVLALACVIGLTGQGVLKLIRRAERVAFMDRYGLTPGCMALTPEELAYDDEQGTPLDQSRHR